MDAFKPSDAAETQEIIGWALSEGKKLSIRGQGSKTGLGRPVNADVVIDLSAQTGITLYEPGELILRAKGGTPLAEIEEALTQAGQQLAFEPTHWGRLYGSSDGGTIGGLVATNASGSRRVKAGALRDNFLGVEAISGRNELFKSGGRVMKNVTGYDLPKLMAGSHGTLGVLTEVTLKVMPKAEQTKTLLIVGTSDRDAMALMSVAMGSTLDVSGAAYLPKNVVSKSSLAEISGIDQGTTLLRLEGYEASLGARVEALKSLVAKEGHTLKPMAGHDGIALLDDTVSEILWQEVSDVAFLAKGDHAIWRISTAPSHALGLATSIGADAWYCDWAGGLVWMAVNAAGSADEEIVRQAVARAGGHATLMRAPDDVRCRVSVFQPQTEPLATLTQNIKKAFDPQKILNFGRMYADV